MSEHGLLYVAFVVRSHLVEKVQDGLSGVTASLLQAFYTQPHDLRQGALFRLHSGRRTGIFCEGHTLSC